MLRKTTIVSCFDFDLFISWAYKIDHALLQLMTRMKDRDTPSQMLSLSHHEVVTSDLFRTRDSDWIVGFEVVITFMITIQ